MLTILSLLMQYIFSWFIFDACIWFKYSSYALFGISFLRKIFYYSVYSMYSFQKIMFLSIVHIVQRVPLFYYVVLKIPCLKM